MEIQTSFKDFSEAVEAEKMNEALLVTKRKHGEKAMEYVSTNAPVRAKVLGFISEKGSVSKKEMMEFFATVEEDMGRKPSWGWLRKNSHLIDSELSEDGDTSYTLTKRGKRVLNVYNNYDKMITAIKDKDKIKEEDLVNAKNILRKNGVRILNENEDGDCPECTEGLDEGKFEAWYTNNAEVLTKELFETMFPDVAHLYEAGSPAWKKMFGVCCANAKAGTDLSPSCADFFKKFDVMDDCDGVS